VVALSNLNGQAPDQIVAQLGTLAFGGTVQLTSERQQTVVPVDTLKKYVGTYSIAPNVNAMITLEGEQLMGQVSGQGKNPLFAESETRFFLKVVDAQLEFFKDAGNVVTHLILYQNGRETRAARTSDTVLVRNEISLPVEKLQQFIGTYTLRPGLDLVLTVESGQLMAQATGQPKGPYFADSERTFFSKRIDVQFEFVPEPDGKITHMIFRQGPTTIKAPKK
jgi:hypothetical protein